MEGIGERFKGTTCAQIFAMRSWLLEWRSWCSGSCERGVSKPSFLRQTRHDGRCGTPQGSHLPLATCHVGHPRNTHVAWPLRVLRLTQFSTLFVGLLLFAGYHVSRGKDEATSRSEVKLRGNALDDGERNFAANGASMLETDQHETGVEHPAEGGLDGAIFILEIRNSDPSDASCSVYAGSVREPTGFAEWRVRPVRAQSGVNTTSFDWAVVSFQIVGPLGDVIAGGHQPGHPAPDGMPMASGYATDGPSDDSDPMCAFMSDRSVWAANHATPFLGWRFSKPRNVARMLLRHTLKGENENEVVMLVETRNKGGDAWTPVVMSEQSDPCAVHGIAESIPPPPEWEQLAGDSAEDLDVDRVGTFINLQPTIFVGIAAYRDPLCHETIIKALKAAEHPFRLMFGVVEQNAHGLGDTPCDYKNRSCTEDPAQLLCVHGDQIRIHRVDARDAQGPTFGRYRADRLYRGEYFVLQIDAHMTFDRYWDTKMISQWQATGNEYAVLSTYPMDTVFAGFDEEGYARGYNRSIDVATLMCESKFNQLGMVVHQSAHDIHPMHANGGPTPILHPIWAAGLSFSRGHRIARVPYDCCLPMMFHGEEFSMAARMWTHGYDFYAPRRSVIFHVYIKRSSPQFMDENNKRFPGAEQRSARRVQALLGTAPNDDFDDREIQVGSRYGLGSRRPLSTYLRLFGYDVQGRTFRKNSCRWVYTQQMHNELTPYLRLDGKGIDYESVLIEEVLKYYFGGRAEQTVEYWS